MNTIVFAGGGSMGHVIKHFAVMPYLEDKFSRFSFIGSKRGPEKNFIGSDHPFYALTPARLDRSDPLSNISLPLDFFKALKESKDILKKENPKVVFCGGGYVCLPVAVAARSLNIPVVLHESDYSLGLANKLCLPFCKAILTTFPDTLKSNGKVRYVGALVRKELLDKNKTAAKARLKLDRSKKTLLVIGGSLGSKAINDCVVSSYEYLTKRYNVIHICGEKKTYDITPKGVLQMPFARDMASVYAATDLAVSRCGSNTAFELFACDIPTLFIPLSKRSSRGDQIENAKFFSERRACKTISEEDLTPQTLVKAVNALENESMLISANMRSLIKSDANERAAKIITRYAFGER